MKLVLLSLSLLLLACGSSHQSAATTPTTTAPNRNTLAVGQKATMPGGMTVLIKQVEYPVAVTDTLKAGGKWTYLGALIEECATTTPADASGFGFLPSLDDNTHPGEYPGAKDDAGYFVQAKLQPGECNAGWESWQIPAGRTVTRIQFHLPAGDGTTATWLLPQPAQ